MVEVPTQEEFAAWGSRVDAELSAVRARVTQIEGQPPTPPPLPAPPATGRIARQGTALTLDGKRYRAAGMNWDQAVGCGLSGSQPSPSQAERYFAESNPQSMTRVWVMPGMPNFGSGADYGTYNWRRYDMLVEAAAKYGQYLCVTLLNGLADCTSRRATYDTPNGQVAPDVAAWVAAVVSRHAGNPAVAVVEPVNEGAEGHANFGAWCQAMARLIKSHDPDVLVGTGGGNNSSDPVKIAAFSSGPDIDLISYHDYYKRWESPAPRAAVFDRAAELAGKPWYFGEVGACSGGWDGGSLTENGRRLTTVYGIHLAMENCAMVLYWDFKIPQPENTTARFDSPLWRAACDYRVG